MLCCDWLFFNSSDWCISILAVHSVICSLGGPTLYQKSSSVSQAKPSTVRNFLAATFDNVVTIIYKQFSIRTMKIRQLTLSKAYKRLCNEFLDKLKLFRHYPTDLFALACIVIYKQLHPSWKTDSDWSERFCYITINYSNKFTIIVKHTHAICIGKTMFSARTKILFFCRFALENFSS